MNYFYFKDLQEKISNLKSIGSSLNRIADAIRSNNTDDSDAEELEAAESFLISKLDELEKLVRERG